MTAPRPTERARRLVALAVEAGLKVACVEALPDGTVRVMTTDDPRVKRPDNSWDDE